MTNNLLLSLLFGFVQGVTEFLPVSSTGHLIILEKLFNLSPVQFGLSFDVALHSGTLFALLIFFRKKIVNILIEFYQGKRATTVLIITGTIPAVLTAALLEKYIENSFRNPLIVAFSLIFFSFVFIMAEIIGQKRKKLNQMNFADSLIIGFFQAIAVLPGASRSGMTISGGLLRNLDRENAGEYAFLLSIPIIFLASAKDMTTILVDGIDTQFILIILAGFLMSLISGYVFIKLFLGYLKKHGIIPFIIYRIILAIIVLLIFKG